MYLLLGERYQSFFPAKTMKLPLKTKRIVVCGDSAARNDNGRPRYLGTATGDTLSD
jgi:hypothetical protein